MMREEEKEDEEELQCCWRVSGVPISSWWFDGLFEVLGGGMEDEEDEEKDRRRGRGMRRMNRRRRRRTRPDLCRFSLASGLLRRSYSHGCERSGILRCRTRYQRHGGALGIGIGCNIRAAVGTVTSLHCI